MLERLVETFCAVDDFCKAFLPHWETYLLSNGSALGTVGGAAVGGVIGNEVGKRIGRYRI